MKEKNIFTKGYYEKFAINVIKHYYPKKFSELKKSECPDWVCGNIGLEVTRAVSTQNGELDAFIKYCSNKDFSSIGTKRLKKNGFETQLSKSINENIYEVRSEKNGTLTFFLTKDGKYRFLYFISKMNMVNDCIDEIINAMEKKLKKLNSNYDKFEENDLAIIVQEQLNYLEIGDLIICKMNEDIVNTIRKLYVEQKYQLMYDYVFIIFFDVMFVIHTKQFDCAQIQISKEDFLSISKKSVELS